MNKIIFLAFLFFLISITPLISAEDAQTISFTASTSPQTFTAYKGSYVDIPVTIRNTAESTISCIVSSSIEDKQLQIDSDYQSTVYFRYPAPSKIKNLDSASISFDTDCSGQYASNCGFLWLETCYIDYEPNPFSHSVTINHELTEQDKANLETLESYQTSLSSKITSIDSQLKTLKTLIDKTPNLLTPENALSEYNSKESDFENINLKFGKVIEYLEDEVYDYVSTYSNPSLDLSTLDSIDQSLQGLEADINFQIEKYETIVDSFNSQVQENSEKIKQYSTSFNQELLDTYYEKTNDLKVRFENYDFSSTDEAGDIILNYQEEYEEIFVQLINREAEFVDNGYSIIKEESESICSINRDCTTESKILNNPSTLNELCQIFTDSYSETSNFNNIILEEYSPILIKLGKVSSVNSVKEIKNNISKEIDSLNEDMESYIKSANRLGKNLEIDNYASLVEEFNTGTISEKEQMLSELYSSKEIIFTASSEISQNENNFSIFFKGLWFLFFGEKQEVPYLDSSSLKDIIELSEDFINFYNDACSYSEVDIIEAEAPNIIADYQSSNIKTEVIDPEETCINEKGERTTECCNDDSFRHRQDLYPVIFIHGHASENGQQTVQNSLSTFSTMSNYFENEGYVTKDILYPEKIDDLTTGIWGYCNPVAVRITYYEGVMSWGDVEYLGSIGDYSPTLKNEINAVLKATNKEKAIIVAHSMGGVLSRYYIKYDGGQPYVDKLITISSPHYGARDLFTLLSPAVEAETREMQPDSDFLNNLNYPQDSLVDSYTFMGDSESCALGLERCDGVVYVEYAQLNGAKNNEIMEGSVYDHGNIVKRSDVSQKILDIIRN